MNKSWCWTGINDPPYDNRSDFAVMAQRILKVDGWYSGAIDGQFGTVSRTAVINYQTNRGTPADGLIGGDTWYYLVYTSISTCPNIPQPGHSNYGYRIGSETCGRYLQQNAGHRWYVRTFNNSGTSVHEDNFINPSVNGPTSRPGVTGTAAQGLTSDAVALSSAEASEYIHLADDLNLEVTRASEIPFEVGEGAVMEDVAFADPVSGATAVRSEAPSTQQDAESLFDHLRTYPAEFGYTELTIDGNFAMTRVLEDGSVNTVMYDAEAGSVATISIDPAGPGEDVPDWLVESSTKLL